MSRQRTQSPRYRRFPWDEPDFDPQKVIADLDGMPMGRGEPEENWDYRRDETFPQSQRRHPQFQQHHRRSEETFQRRRLSPYHDSPQYTDGGEGPRRREKFRENAGRYEDRRGATQPEHNRNYTQRSQSNQREPGWRQDQPEHGTRERFRDRSPLRPDEHRQAGQGRGQQLRNNPNTDRRRPNQDRSQQFNRNRREMDGSSQFGSMLYSSDRQLSLDLVNVGRQRLDFLPMMEHSGTYRENTTHTGTFAEEIITLVHQVKDQYFGGEGIPLNERFSAPQKSAYVEEEPQEMTLSERFGAKRGVNVNLGSLVDSEEPLFSRQGPLQLSAPHTVRDPDDLRHDLEKRRQERLEGVKVTIAGQHALPQRPLGPKSEPVYDDNNDVMDDAEFLNWSEEPNRRPEGSMGQRRGGTFRQNNAPFRRNNRQMRRGGPNYRNNTGGPNW